MAVIGADAITAMSHKIDRRKTKVLKILPPQRRRLFVHCPEGLDRTAQGKRDARTVEYRAQPRAPPWVAGVIETITEGVRKSRKAEEMNTKMRTRMSALH